MTDAILVPDGELLVPTGHAAGPWDLGQLHGGVPAAALARAVERATAPMRLTRLTLEFLAPVPMAPLDVGVEIVRPGRRLQFLRGWVRAGGREVLRAQATVLRTGDVPVPAPAPAPPLPGPEESARGAWEVPAGTQGFHLTGMDVRFAAGDWRPGPATAWFRLAVPLVLGEEPTPVQRVAAACDFGNGIASEVGFDTHLFVNPDLTLQLAREPVGEWVALISRTLFDPAGIGLATSELRDARGRIGAAAQSLYVDARED